MGERKIFLIDGFGGLVTGVMLGFVLPLFKQHIAIPKEILYGLSFLGFLYGLYSLSCYFYVKSNLSKWLCVIIFANLFYCLLSVAFIFVFYNSLSWIGLAYFIIEKVIILTLVYVEFKIYKKWKVQN